MSVVVANAKNSDVLWLVIHIVVIDVVKICADTSGFAPAARASIFRQQEESEANWGYATLGMGLVQEELTRHSLMRPLTCAGDGEPQA